MSLLFAVCVVDCVVRRLIDCLPNLSAKSSCIHSHLSCKRFIASLQLHFLYNTLLHMSYANTYKHA